MLFYPDQYFYGPYQRKASVSNNDARRQSRAAPVAPQPRASQDFGFFPQQFVPQRGYFPNGYPFVVAQSNEEDEEDDEDEVEFQRRPSSAAFGAGPFRAPYSAPAAQQILRSPYDQNEYIIVQDRDELDALRAYREKKNRETELAQRRREAYLRQQEHARIARERAEQIERERRLRAAAESNARAAARAYIRRKQAEQVAQMQAEYEEKKQRQQDALEKLLNPFIFGHAAGAAYGAGARAETGDGADAADQANTYVDANEKLEGVPAGAESGESGGAESTAEAAAADAQNRKSEQDLAQEEAKQYIRLLVDSLAPNLIRTVEPSESSDEEPEQAHTTGAANDDDDDDDEDADGPHCETASETSDANVSEIVDPLSQPPQPREEASDAEVESPIVDTFDSAAATTSSSREASPSKQEKRRKQESSRGKKSRRRSREASVAETTPEATIDQLKLWKQKLDGLKKSEQSLNSETTDPSEVSAAKKKVRTLIVKTEDIYNNLDSVRVARDYRRMKHDLTSDAVALADQLELALLRLNSAKSSSPKYHVTLEDVTDDDSS